MARIVTRKTIANETAPAVDPSLSGVIGLLPDTYNLKTVVIIFDLLSSSGTM